MFLPPVAFLLALTARRWRSTCALLISADACWQRLCALLLPSRARSSARRNSSSLDALRRLGRSDDEAVRSVRTFRRSSSARARRSAAPSSSGCAGAGPVTATPTAARERPALGTTRGRSWLSLRPRVRARRALTTTRPDRKPTSAARSTARAHSERGCGARGQNVASVGVEGCSRATATGPLAPAGAAAAPVGGRCASREASRERRTAAEMPTSRRARSAETSARQLGGRLFGLLAAPAGRGSSGSS